MMLGSVAIVFAILTQFAGHWGVPYFSFTTDRGSTCTNDWTGYTCDQLTVNDLNWWGDTALPADTSIRSARYVSTHDYTLDATVEVPEQQAAADPGRAEGVVRLLRQRPSGTAGRPRD